MFLVFQFFFDLERRGHAQPQAAEAARQAAAHGLYIILFFNTFVDVADNLDVAENSDSGVLGGSAPESTVTGEL